MTIPYMMNCSHMGDGWCIACVRELGERERQLYEAIQKHRDQFPDEPMAGEKELWSLLTD
jgi:hypothetical protein